MGTACAVCAQMLPLPPRSNLIKGHVQNGDAENGSMSRTPNPLTLTHFNQRKENKPQLLPSTRASLSDRRESQDTVQTTAGKMKRGKRENAGDWHGLDSESSHPWHNCHLQLPPVDGPDDARRGRSVMAALGEFPRIPSVPCDHVFIKVKKNKKNRSSMSCLWRTATVGTDVREKKKKKWRSPFYMIQTVKGKTKRRALKKYNTNTEVQL